MPLATVDDLNNERVCHHMNTEHAACVYGMVASIYGVNDKIKDVQMIRFAMDRCDFTFNLNGKEKHTFLPFEPPLQSIKEARSRFDSIYQQVLTPKFTWIYLDPVALTVVVMSILVGYMTLALGVHGITSLVQHIPQIHAVVVSSVGSAEGFARILTVGWYFMILAHGFEAMFVYLNAKRSLRLKESSILEWVIFTLFAGLPIVNRFLSYLELQQAGRKKLP